jgi:cytochrome b
MFLSTTVERSVAMKRVLVWDLPVRLFHWLFAGAIVVAFVLANAVDDESTAFAVHMLLGLVAGFMVVLRVVWGLVGSRHARFGDFAFSPGALFRYLKSTLTRSGERHAGHNPATSWAAIAMFALVLGLGATGLAMGAGVEAAEEVHELFAWALIAVAGGHVAGVVWHTIRHRENIALSMVDGRKEADEAQGIRTVRPVAALVFLALTGAWAGLLVQGYDPATSAVTLPFAGARLQLGEGEHGERREHHAERDDDDHDD